MTYTFRTAFLLVFAAFSALSAAQPEDRNREMSVTLTAPLEITGVVLPAGQYIFKLVDLDSNRQLIQVFNQDQSEPLTSFPAADESAEAQSVADGLEDPAAAANDDDSAFEVVVVPDCDDEDTSEQCVTSAVTEDSDETDEEESGAAESVIVLGR